MKQNRLALSLLVSLFVLPSFALSLQTQVNARIELHCRFAEEWIKLHAIVRRSHTGDIGVEFVDLCEHDLARIRAYVQMLESHHSGRPAVAATT
mgnify:CR=1 FL=1